MCNSYHDHLPSTHTYILWLCMLSVSHHHSLHQLFLSVFLCLPIAVMAIVKELQTQLLSPTGQLHPLHVYTNAKIALESTLLQRMNRLSPAEFEQVLHPVFQVGQDEWEWGGVG